MKMYPIEPMSKVKFDWVPKVLQEFKQAQEIPHPVPYTTIRKCPAVFDILKTGYIVRLPYDIHIDITHIAGCSIGSFVGLMFAFRLQIDEMETIIFWLVFCGQFYICSRHQTA